MTTPDNLERRVAQFASDRDFKIGKIHEQAAALELNLAITPISINTDPKFDSTAVAVLSLKGLGELEGMLTELADRRRHAEEAASA